MKKNPILLFLENLPIRVIHVIKEVENEVLQQISVLDEAKKSKSIVAIAKRDSNMEDQLQWSYCLTSLVGYLNDLCPNSLQFALNVISLRIGELRENVERAPNPFQNTELAKKSWEDVCNYFLQSRKNRGHSPLPFIHLPILFFRRFFKKIF